MIASPLPTVLAIIALIAGVSASSSKTSYAKATFVPPAALSLVSPLKRVKSSAGWPSAVNHPSRAHQQIANGYGTYSMASTSLLAKKKKGGGGDPVSKKSKVHVKLLETVRPYGQKGDLVFVSTAVYNNQLKLSNKARIISDEEVQKLELEKEAHEQEMLEMAKKTKAIMEEAMVENLGGEDFCEADGDIICGVGLVMKRKSGPEGNLFGAVNPKVVMEALKQKFPKGSWDGKQVKLVTVKDVDGKDVKKKDIKHIGEYSMTVSLGKDVDVDFILSILAE